MSSYFQGNLPKTEFIKPNHWKKMEELRKLIKSNDMKDLKYI